MTKTTLALACLWWGGCAADPTDATESESESESEAEAPRSYLGMFTDRAFDEIEELVGRLPSVMQIGITWDDGTDNFPLNEVDAIRDAGVIPDILWSPLDYAALLKAVGPVPEQPDFALRRIIEGDWDDYITGFAASAAEWGQPFFLRFGHEMNGEWYPWSETVNGNEPGEYVEMFQHVHDLFEEVCSGCATWVWAPDAGGQSYKPPRDFEDLYPGDDYVDWTGLSAYNVDVALYPDDAVWQELADNAGPAHDRLLALAPDKPIYIAETASAEVGGDKAAWLRNALQALQKRLTGVRAWSYFDVDASEQGFPVTAVDSSPEALEAFREIANDPYFAEGDFGDLPAGAIAPPD